MVIVILAASLIGIAHAESGEDRANERRAIKLFMDGCVHFGGTPDKRAYWLRNEGALRPIKNEAKGVLWADGLHDDRIMLLNGDDGLCSVLLLDTDAASLAADLPNDLRGTCQK